MSNRYVIQHHNMHIAGLIGCDADHKIHYHSPSERPALAPGGGSALCVPAATAPGPSRTNGGCLTGGGSSGGPGHLRKTGARQGTSVAFAGFCVKWRTPQRPSTELRAAEEWSSPARQ